MGVSHHDQQRLGPGDGHIEPLGVLEEAQLVLVVRVDILRGAADRGHNDDSPLLALELLRAPHHHLLRLLVLAQLLPDLLHLASVGSDHTNLLGLDLNVPGFQFKSSHNYKQLDYLVALHLQQLLDVVRHDNDLLNVKETWTALFLQVLANNPVENHRNLVPLGLGRQPLEVEAALYLHLVRARLQLVVVEELLGHGEQLRVGPEVPDELGDAALVVAAAAVHVVHVQAHQPLQQAHVQAVSDRKLRPETIIITKMIR